MMNKNDELIKENEELLERFKDLVDLCKEKKITRELAIRFFEYSTENYDPKFSIGDKVKIVKYGHVMKIEQGELHLSQHKEVPPVLLFDPPFTDIKYYDTRPDLVGKHATVINTTYGDQGWSYYLEGVTKTCWYSEDQLELI